MTGYSDGRVRCTDQEIVIRHYYLLGPRHIRYTDIRQVKVAPLGPWGQRHQRPGGRPVVKALW